MSVVPHTDKNHTGGVKKLQSRPTCRSRTSCISWNLPLNMTSALISDYDRLFTLLFYKLIICVWLILRILDLLMRPVAIA